METKLIFAEGRNIVPSPFEGYLVHTDFRCLAVTQTGGDNYVIYHGLLEVKQPAHMGGDAHPDVNNTTALFVVHGVPSASELIRDAVKQADEFYASCAEELERVKSGRDAETPVHIQNFGFPVGTRVCLKSETVRDGKDFNEHRAGASITGMVVGPDVSALQDWTPVLWDDRDDPEFIKTMFLEVID